MKWIIKFFKNYFKFNGRASRKEYGMFGLITLFVVISGFVIDYMLDANFIIAIIAVVFLMIPGYSAGVRRLHDLGYSGSKMLRSNIFLTIKMLTQEGEGPNEYGEPPIE